MSDRAETCSWCDGDSCWVCGYADGREAAWPLNLSANLAAAGMAATMRRWADHRCEHNATVCVTCLAGDAVDTMREAVS